VSWTKSPVPAVVYGVTNAGNVVLRFDRQSEDRSSTPSLPTLIPKVIAALKSLLLERRFDSHC
jgi:hypothetical protein